MSIGKSISSETESISPGTRPWRCSAMRLGSQGRRIGYKPNIRKDWMTSRLPASVGMKPRLMRSLQARACPRSITGIGLQDLFPRRLSCRQATSAAPVSCRSGSKPDMSPWGNYDMAGNVKEWIWNEADSGKRYVLGGAWDEPNYMFVDPDAQSPFLRTANIGFRCVKYIEPEADLKIAAATMATPRRDLSKEKPASDDLFRAYRGVYSYDKIPLNATVEPFGKNEEDWRTERITYTAAYGQREGGCLPVSAQEEQATLPDGCLLSWIECASTACVLGLPDSCTGWHSQERPRGTLSRVQGNV